MRIRLLLAASGLGPRLASGLALGLVLGLALILASGAVSAAVARNLYEAGVPVADQAAETRGPALRAAFETVLVRVTGMRVLPAEAAALLPRANEFVQGYGYEAAPAGGGLRLKAQFDARAVDAALRAMNLPLWGVTRPYHLAWIAVRDDAPPRAVLDAANPHAAIVTATAERRGLPLNLPALDTGERQSIDFGKVWDSDLPALRQASRRYAPDALVAARVAREGGRWVGRWTLLDNSAAAQEWSESSDTLDGALAAGIDALADRQAARFAVQGGGRARELRLAVAGIQSVKDYGRALNYVRSLGAVRATQVERAQGNVLTLRVQVEGDPDALSRVIASGSVLRADAATPSGADLAYQLVTP